jgi:transposase, IS30 family
VDPAVHRMRDDARPAQSVQAQLAFRQPRLGGSRLELHWSPEQIAGRLRRDKVLAISHETIYRYIWYDKREGGTLYLFLRGSRKQKWKRYRSYDSRGRMRGKRPIAERPAGAENRSLGRPPRRRYGDRRLRPPLHPYPGGP